MPTIKKLEWGNEAQQSAILAESGPFEYILCADVVYHLYCFFAFSFSLIYLIPIQLHPLFFPSPLHNITTSRFL